ncbi:MAG: 4Fe-4S dicluster domain-containing protein, partial [Acidimicrobiales bacterium]
MPRYGFLIDQDTCIGCHACTLACKAEYDVPIGVNRTWVKYIEKGEFPHSRRYYSVMRCNHCEDAPCVKICPTNALFHRDDGIVDFNDSNCIACKSCMNACPYDAIFINPETHTANKCNFCAPRVEVGLEPSCVIVCPTQSIWAGDLDDPESRISQAVGRQHVMVRAPEQGTRPKLFYKGADQASLVPTETRIAKDGMIWSRTAPDHSDLPAGNSHHPVSGRTAYTTRHPMTWKGMVSAYLVTKSIAAGSLMLAAVLALTGHAHDSIGVGVVPAAIALVFTGITTVLLVADLKQPMRFYYLLTRPNFGSWLVKGGIILTLYSVFAAAWLVAGILGASEVLVWLAVPVLALGLATAGYTAYLFGQCEGRDLWQTPLLLPVLLT